MKQLSLVLFTLLFGLLSSCLKTDNTLSQQVAQFNSDTTAIASFLKANQISATELSGQGVWFIIDSAASGIRPTFSDTVYVKYSIKSIPGNTVFAQVNTTTLMTLSDFMQGVQIAMPQFQKGSKGRIFLPSSLGYGNVANGNIPANSVLDFEFQLVDVKDHQLMMDTTAIGTYLRTNAINAFKDPSGLRYTIQSLGSGGVPALTNRVQVTYKAKVLSNDVTVVDQGNSVVFQLSSLILGWQIGLSIVPVGSTITLYVPSSLAYGPRGSGTSIKGNQNMIFNIQFLGISQ